MDNTKSELKRILLHRGIAYIRDMLVRDMASKTIGIVFVTPDLRLAAEVAKLLHAVPFHKDEEALTEVEISWINREAKEFLLPPRNYHLVAFRAIDYIEYLLTLATEEQKAAIDGFILQTIRTYDVNRYESRQALNYLLFVGLLNSEAREAVETLTRFGHTVVTLMDGYQAKMYIEQHETLPAVLFAHEKMPGLPGKELLEWFRKQYPEASTKRILSVRMLSKNAPFRQWDGLADSYLLYPYSPWQLILSVEQLLFTPGKNED